MSWHRKSNRYRKSIAAAVSAAVFIVAPVVPAMAASIPTQTQTASFGLPTSGYIEAEFSPLIEGSGNTISIMSPSLLGNNIGGYDFTFNGGRLGVQSGLATIYDTVNNSASTNGPNGSTTNFTSSNLLGYAFPLGSVPEGGWDAALSTPNTTGSGAPTFWADAQYSVTYPHAMSVSAQTSSISAGSTVQITAALNTTDPYAQAASADLQAPWMPTPVPMTPGASPGTYTYELQVPGNFSGAANIQVGMQYTTLQASVPQPGEEQVSAATLSIAGGTGLSVQAAPSGITVSPSGQQSQAGVPITFSGTVTHLGVPVSGATVSLVFDGQNGTATTGSDGGYGMTVTPKNAGYSLLVTVKADGLTAVTTDSVTPAPIQAPTQSVPDNTYQQQSVPQVVYQPQPFYIPTQPFISTPPVTPTTNTPPAGTVTNSLSSMSLAVFAQETQSLSGFANLAAHSKTPRWAFFASVADLIGIQPAASESTALPWTDTKGLPPHTREILQALYNAGLVKGFPNGTLEPNLPLTHEQEVLMVSRTLEYLAQEMKPSANGFRG